MSKMMESFAIPPGGLEPGFQLSAEMLRALNKLFGFERQGNAHKVALAHGGFVRARTLSMACNATITNSVQYHLRLLSGESMFWLNPHEPIKVGKMWLHM